MSLKAPVPSEHSRITIGVVTFNSAAHIAACLDSICHNLGDAFPTIIVLDNASTDNTLEVLNDLRKRLRFPPHIIAQDMNRGYAWAANRICELVRTDWICLINPDARLMTPAFQHAITTTKRYPTCGVIGGIITDPSGSPQECGGVFPTPLMAVWDWCGLRRIFPRPSWSTTLKWSLPHDAPPRQIDYPTGAFWLMRREVYSRVGPFDERFFLYFEETDFCRRAREKQWPSFIHPAIRIEHIRGASFEKSSTQPGSPSTHITRDPLSIYFESLRKYLHKHFTEWRVNTALSTIHNFLKLRAWLRKDEKSTRILKVFEDAARRV